MLFEWFLLKWDEQVKRFFGLSLVWIVLQERKTVQVINVEEKDWQIERLVLFEVDASGLEVSRSKRIGGRLGMDCR